MKTQADKAEVENNAKATASAKQKPKASATVEAAARTKARTKNIVAHAKARYNNTKPQASATKEDSALAERVAKLAAAVELTMTPAQSINDAKIKERMAEFERQQIADDKRSS